MTIIYMLLAISVFVALIFFALFIFSVKKGQYDDTYTPSVRMLFDDELVKEGSSSPKNTSKENKTNPEK
ncbi:MULTISPECIES: cbb3-type cytochrome oxidase assembly protein CcoS [Aequorivita]|uniref:Cbb3-type cytochrome oxidase assembly protein CcoS n=1 Tax=Aequorivita iocasae TaxID=2803865 RepID=A0ABX7DNW8_9FLAO|nr:MULTISPECIES: cbb3-type cytochrome oxidase assembly protein CcoS [Aequorivita]QQX75825.1 cbb3-type cytochrome oxidase assembly protein CcoS [Aequorivita iocasae]UCA55285.1 cbb3-type cytochrome oxidase assembly protein CcoS [Aequorivita sp. F7]